jgi:hypothetical protein
MGDEGGGKLGGKLGVCDSRDLVAGLCREQYVMNARRVLSHAISRLTNEIILFCCPNSSKNEYLPRTLALNSCKHRLYYQRGAAAAIFVEMFKAAALQVLLVWL